MKKANERKPVLKALAKVAETEANMKHAGWPPICAGIIYQPKRPQKKD